MRFRICLALIASTEKNQFWAQITRIKAIILYECAIVWKKHTVTKECIIQPKVSGWWSAKCKLRSVCMRVRVRETRVLVCCMYCISKADWGKTAYSTALSVQTSATGEDLFQPSVIMSHDVSKKRWAKRWFPFLQTEQGAVLQLIRLVSLHRSVSRLFLLLKGICLNCNLLFK